MPTTRLGKLDVALVSMPWAPFAEPSLGLCILKSSLAAAGFSSEVFHFAPCLLRWITPETYSYIANAWALNEFVFTGTLDPQLGAHQQNAIVSGIRRYCKAVARHDKYPRPEDVLDLLMRIRCNIVPKFLQDVAAQISESQAKVVGFTCLFDQTMASLALAKVLKDTNPALTILLGGYALEGPPGRAISNAFNFIDYVLLGDGEAIIVDIVRRIVAKGTCLESRRNCQSLEDQDLTFIAAKGSNSRVTYPERLIRAPTYDINCSPVPDYDDWFETLTYLKCSHDIDITADTLPVESSRGCWWGERKHCVFCGIDNDTLRYRFKKATITLSMLRDLRRRYGDVTFRFSDYIMPKAYYSTLLPALALESPRFRLHSEIKANHDRDRIELLVRAGFIGVQPGVESFSTEVLRSMDKGVRGIDNVSLLKSGYLERLQIHYNILYGLPSDLAPIYEKMLKLIPHIYHLTPPVGRTPIIVTRFAPLHEDYKRFGAAPPKHDASYDALFSDMFLQKTSFCLDDYVYYFETNFTVGDEMPLLYEQLVAQIDHWKALHKAKFVELSYSHQSEGIALGFTDTRFGDKEEYALGPLASSLYLEFDDRPVIIERAFSRAGAKHNASTDELNSAFTELEDKRLIWKEGNLVFGVGVPKTVSNGYRLDGWPQEWVAIYM